MFDDAADWPTQGFRLHPWVSVPDPAFWREHQRQFWHDERSRPRILADLRQLRIVLERPIPEVSGFVDNASVAAYRAYQEAEQKRRDASGPAGPPGPGRSTRPG